MAAGKAFSFGYAEHAELLRAAGADVVDFDPLTDPLPDGTDAVLLPGGFPEQFTAELSANDVVRQQINELAAAGAPVHAECAGLIYLASELDGYPMCGVLAGIGALHPKSDVGYRDAVAVADSALYAAGARVVGHEFHRTAVTFTQSYQPAWVYRAGERRDGAVCATASCTPAYTRRICTLTLPRPPTRWCVSSPTPPTGRRRAGNALSLPGDREPLPGRIAADRQEGRRGRRRHGRPASATPAHRQWRRHPRDQPLGHPRSRGDGRNHLVAARISATATSTGPGMRSRPPMMPA